VTLYNMRLDMRKHTEGECRSLLQIVEDTWKGYARGRRRKSKVMLLRWVEVHDST